MNSDPATPSSRATTRPQAGRGRRTAAGLLSNATLATLAALTGCGSTPDRPIRPEFDLHDPNPTRRTKAVAQVAASRDSSQVPALINLLDDEDEAVRLAAGRALRDVTGCDTGYKASDPPEVRAKQAEAWRTWWEAQSRGGKAAPAAAPKPAPAASGGTRVGSP